MAVDTLSPDWEFDRVDDGSQSKPPGVGRRGPGGSAEGGRHGAALRSRPLGTLPQSGTGRAAWRDCRGRVQQRSCRASLPVAGDRPAAPLSGARPPATARGQPLGCPSRLKARARCAEPSVEL